MNQYKFCINCGKKIRASSHFCPYCRAKQPTGGQSTPTAQPTMNQTYQAPRPKRRRFGKHKWILAVVVVILLVLGFVGYQHTSMSINLNREIPNNTWTMKGNQDFPTIKNAHFKADSMSGNASKGENDLKYMTIKPTGRKTANFIVKGNDYIKLQMVAKSGNEHSFKLVPTHKAKMLIDGHQITVKNGRAYADGKSHAISNHDLDDMFSFKLKLTKE